MKVLSVLMFLLFFSWGLKAQMLSAFHSWTSGDNGEMSIDVLINTEAEEVTITFTGPENDWFAYGFGNFEMENTYAIVHERVGGSTVTKERSMGNHNAGSELVPRYEMVSESVEMGLRTITLKIPSTGTGSYYSFPTEPGPIPLISATGFGGTLGFHSDNYLQGFQGGANDLEFSSVVPVTWAKFTLDSRGRNAALHWETSSEISNEGFYIQRSMDARSWKDIGFVRAKDEQGSSYSYIDNSTLPGVNYYRLRQVDLDGSKHFSVIKSIEIEGNARPDDITLYPNPVKEQLNISKPESDGVKRIQIIDVNYRVIIDEIWDSGANEHQINLSDFPAGHYVIIIKNKSWMHMDHFVKQ